MKEYNNIKIKGFVFKKFPIELKIFLYVVLFSYSFFNIEFFK